MPNFYMVVRLAHDGEANLREFFKYMVGRLGMGWHPDTLAAEYFENGGLGPRRSFEDFEAREIDAAMIRIFELMDPDLVYRVAFEVMREHLQRN